MTININIRTKIDKANNQLGRLEARKKILLLVNKYLFGERIINFIEFFTIEALAYFYFDLLNHKNIDEIWLQIENANNKFSHHLIYDRDLLISFDKKKIKQKDKQRQQLFEKWLYTLQNLGDEHKDKLFNFSNSYFNENQEEIDK
jgi:hypothetical protein